MGVSSMVSWLTDFILPPLFGTFLDKFGNTGYTYLFIVLAVLGAAGVLLSLITISRDKKFKRGELQEL